MMNRAATNSIILIAILLAIIGLNILFYAETAVEEEYEWNGSRSTYSPRLYGTRAFYLLLRDRGYKAIQFEEPLDRLKDRVDVTAIFIIEPPAPLSTREMDALEDWVNSGGHLVIVDREINWSIAGGTIELSTRSKYKLWRLPHVIQPTPLTTGVNRVQLTEFAQGVKAEGAPVTEHVGDQGDAALIDFRFGRGRIVLLGEPYILANNGIERSDNVTLAMNIVRSMPDGTIAFDEYHHGHGTALASRSGLVGGLLNIFDYFRQTPVMGVLLQLCLIAAAMLYSRGRRFSRPIPLSMEKRSRSLEYVASMGNLAHRQGLRALVYENIHRSLKRHLVPRGGSDGPIAGPGRGEINEFLLEREPSMEAQTMNDRGLLEWVRRVRESETRMKKIR
jgi:hypothetical protein